MKLITRFLSFLVRVTAIDGALIILTWCEGIVSGLVKLLQPYAMHAQSTKLLSITEMRTAIFDKVAEDVYIVQKEYDVSTGKAVTEVRSCLAEMKQMVTEFEETHFDYDESSNVSTVSSIGGLQ